MAFKMMGWSPFNKPSDNKKAGDIYDKAFAMDSSKIDYSKYKNVDLSEGLGYSYGKSCIINKIVVNYFINNQNNPKGKPAPKPTKSTKNKRSIWAKGDIKPQTTMKGGKTGEITELDIKAYGASGKPQSQRHKK